MASMVSCERILKSQRLHGGEMEHKRQNAVWSLQSGTPKRKGEQEEKGGKGNQEKKES